MPLLKLHKIQDHTLVGVWYVTESLGELEAHPALFSYIEESYQFKSSKRRREWLVVRLLLNELLGSSASISYHPSGRPFLVDSMYSISVSHTDSYVALIVSKKAKVSIDIEYISTRINRITRRFLRSDESFALAENKLLSNLLIWCSKELLFKLIDQSNIDFNYYLKFYDNNTYKNYFIKSDLEFVMLDRTEENLWKYNEKNKTLTISNNEFKILSINKTNDTISLKNIKTNNKSYLFKLR